MRFESLVSITPQSLHPSEAVDGALAPWLTEHFARRARKLVGEGS